MGNAEARLPGERLRANVLGVGVDAVNLEAAVEKIDSAIAAGRKGYVSVTGVHGIMEAQKDPEFRAILNRSLMTTPDGMPAVWVGRLQGHRDIRRVFGPDLMLRVCAMSISRGYRHFLYGGAPGVAEQLRRRLMDKFDRQLNIVGTYTPPYRALTTGELSTLQHVISKLRPDLFWVGLSTPKQERFMAEYLGLLDTKVMIGVGAAFDYLTGRIHDAPDWMKTAGLQWLHRLWQEPRRLLKRYLTNNPQFIYKITLQLTGVTKYRSPDASTA